MKYNLIFGGIPESENRDLENCENVRQKFINEELGITGDIDSKMYTDSANGTTADLETL